MAVDFVAMLAKSLKKTANLLTSNIGESVRRAGNIIWVRTLDLNQCRLHRLRDQLEKSQRIILGKSNGTECRFHNKEVEQMQYFKLQIGCMLIVLYVAFIYIREKYEYKVKQKEPGI